MSLYDNIRRVTPYVPGEQPAGKVIKLNTNECPYAPSPRVSEAIAACDAGHLRLYPEPDCHTLKEAIAAHYAVKPDEVFVGVGSDDVLALAFLTFFAGQKPVLFPDITYSFYDVWAELYAIPYETVPLAADFTLRPEDYARENGGVIFANPNAPTGLALPLSGVEEILAKNPESVVIVDEAYVDFGAETALPLLKKYENLVVVRTMSKSRALAGMRIGYAFAAKRLIRAMEDVKASINSYTMTTLSLSAGKAGRRLLSGNAWKNHQDARGNEGVTSKAWLFRHGIEDELPLRAKSRHPGANALRRAAKARHLCALLQETTHRRTPAHHHRHGRGHEAASRRTPLPQQKMKNAPGRRNGM